MPKPPPTLSSIIRARFMVRPPSSGTQSTTGRRCFSWKTTTVLCSMGGGAPFLAVAVTTTCTRSDEAGGWAAAARPAESKTSPRSLNEGFISHLPLTGGQLTAVLLDAVFHVKQSRRARSRRGGELEPLAGKEVSGRQPAANSWATLRPPAAPRSRRRAGLGRRPRPARAPPRPAAPPQPPAGRGNPPPGPTPLPAASS